MAEWYELPVSVLSADDATAIVKALDSKYNSPDFLSGMRFYFDSHVLDRDAWQWVSDLVKADHNVLLLFKVSKTWLVFNLVSGNHLRTVLESLGPLRVPTYEFYVTNSTLDYLCFYDHENSLYVAGTAASWLASMNSRLCSLIGIEAGCRFVDDIAIDYGARNVQLTFSSAIDSDTTAGLTLRNCTSVAFDLERPTNLPARIQHLLLRELDPPSGKKQMLLKTRHYSLRVTFYDFLENPSKIDK